MPPINEPNGLPRSKWPNVPVQQDFPQERPIFWGPGQETHYPGLSHLNQRPLIYNKPVGWHRNQPMGIPKVYRLFHGSNPQKIEHFYIYIGYRNGYVCTFNIPGGGSCSEYGHIYNKFEPFIQEVEIQSEYNANMSTLTAVEVQDIVTAHTKARPNPFQLPIASWSNRFATITKNPWGRGAKIPYSLPCGTTMVYDVIQDGSPFPDPEYIGEIGEGTGFPPDFDSEFGYTQVDWVSPNPFGALYRDICVSYYLSVVIHGPINPDSQGKTWTDPHYQNVSLGYTYVNSAPLAGKRWDFPKTDLTPEDGNLDFAVIPGLAIGLIP